MDFFGGMEKHQAFMRAMARKNKASGSAVASPLKASASSGPRPSHSVNPALKIHDLGDDDKPTANEPQKTSKRKASKEKTPSPPKRRKTAGPMLTGPLDPNVNVAERLQFNLTAEEKKPFKDMSPSDSLNMAYELIARASVCMNYFAGTTKPLLVTELETTQKSLDVAKKQNSTLTTHLESLRKSIEDDRAKATAFKVDAEKKIAQLEASITTLKEDLEKSNAKIEDLVKDKEALLTERDKLLVDNAALEDGLCNERQTGFEQGIAQCNFFFKTPLDHDGFDIMKVVVDGHLVDLSDQAAAVNTDPADGDQNLDVPTAIPLAESTDLHPIQP